MNKKLFGVLLLSTILASMTIPMIAAPVRIPHDHTSPLPDDYFVKQPLDGGDKSMRKTPNEYIWTFLMQASSHLVKIFSQKLGL